MIRHLYYFQTIAEERHFGRAAEHLGMTQPPLSAQIKVLERVLGVKLFERSRAGVKLTHHGEAILPAVQRMVANAERLESVVHLTRTGQLHSLSVGAVASAMLHPLEDGIQRARAQFPELTVSLVEMDTGEAIRALEAEEIDVAFVRTENVAKPLACKPMIRERLMVVMRPEHALSRYQEISLQDVAKEALVMCPRNISPAYFDAINRQFTDVGLSLKVPHFARSIMSQIAMVSCGLGLAIVPKSFTNFETNKVIYRPLDSKAEVVTTAAVWNEERVTPAMLRFIEIVGS
nr:LysR family transcriptional regulator [uncultured Shinella sp.]